MKAAPWWRANADQRAYPIPDAQKPRGLSSPATPQGLRKERTTSMEAQAPDAVGEAASELPVALCRALKGPRTRQGRMFELVIDKCPFCGLKHAHGGGTGTTPVLGRRLSHCADSSLRRSYELRVGGGQ